MLFVQSWQPENPPRAVVLIQHGFCEHGGRYTHVANRFVSNGNAVYVMDLRGHGRSHGKRAYVDRFEQHVDDFQLFAQYVQLKHPNLPLFVIAHSMGGAVALLWTLTCKPNIAGLILSGAALVIAIKVPGWLMAISGLVSRFLPHVPTLRLADPGILSQDKKVLDDRATDPLVYRNRVPARGGAEVMRGASLVHRQLENIVCPLLILHGRSDALIDPIGSQHLYDCAQSTDKTVIFYDNQRHEILNEPDQDRVMNDICTWIDQRCPQKEATA